MRREVEAERYEKKNHETEERGKQESTDEGRRDK